MYVASARALVFLPPLVTNRGGIYVHTRVRRSNWIERVSPLLLSVSHRTMSIQFLYRKHWHRRPAAVVRCYLPPVSGPLVNLLRTIGRSIARTCMYGFGGLPGRTTNLTGQAIA